MVIIWGQRMFGRVDRFAGSYVATRFFHLYYVPLIPLSSWLVLEEQLEGAFRGVQVPLQGRSIGLAWLRVGAVVGGLVAALSYFPREQLGRATGAASQASLGALVALGAAVLVGLYAYLRMGRLRGEEKAARVVYWDFSGQFVDVALLGAERAAVKQRATEELERQLARHSTAGYREAPKASWRELAVQPELNDVPLLKAALTRSRIEWSEAKGKARLELERDHATILANLLVRSPDLLDVQRFELKV